MTMLDSKKKSASEALVNALGGFPVGYGLGIIILPISTGWIQEDPYMANIAITGAYAITSFVRSYFLRRVFEKYGIDDNFIKLGIKLFKNWTGEKNEAVEQGTSHERSDGFSYRH